MYNGFLSKFKILPTTLFWMILLFLIAIGLAIFLLGYQQALSHIVDSVFILTAAIFASYFAIHQYQTEQRTSRLQRLYFEDTFLGESKALEKMLSQANQNYLMNENLYNLLKNVLCQIDKFENIKQELLTLLSECISESYTKYESLDFKKETIADMIFSAGYRNNYIVDWIHKIEIDINRFNHFLKSQLIIIKFRTAKLVDSEVKDYEKMLTTILNEVVDNNYQLIKRHYVFLTIFCLLLTKLTAINYSNPNEIVNELKADKFSKLLNLIDRFFQSLVLNFSKIDVTNINSSEALRLKQAIIEANQELKAKLCT